MIMYYANYTSSTIRDIDVTLNKVKDDINKRLNHIEKILKRERWVKKYGHTERYRNR